MPEALRPIIRFMTGETAVSNAIVEIRFDVNAPVFVQCRDQANAYYIRLLGSLQDAATPVSAKDHVCGRWDDFYWHFDPNGKQGPTLYRTDASPTGTNSLAFQRQRTYLKALLTGFRTLGLTADVNERIEWDGENIAIHHALKDQVLQPRFLVTDGTPKGVELRRVADGSTRTVTIDYDYGQQGDAVRIPSTAICRNHSLDIIVHALTVLPDGRALPQSEFTVPEVLREQGVSNILYTNGVDHHVLEDGRLVRIDRRIPEREVATRDFGRRFFVLGIVVLTLCMLPVLIAARRRRRGE